MGIQKNHFFFLGFNYFDEKSKNWNEIWCLALTCTCRCLCYHQVVSCRGNTNPRNEAVDDRIWNHGIFRTQQISETKQSIDCNNNSEGSCYNNSSCACWYCSSSYKRKVLKRRRVVGFHCYQKTQLPSPIKKNPNHHPLLLQWNKALSLKPPLEKEREVLFCFVCGWSVCEESVSPWGFIAEVLLCF